MVGSAELNSDLPDRPLEDSPAGVAHGDLSKMRRTFEFGSTSLNLYNCAPILIDDWKFAIYFI
jgi:hypothetical protein